MIIVLIKENKNNIIQFSSSLQNTLFLSSPRPAHAFKTDAHIQETEWLWPVDDTQMMFVAGHDAGVRFASPAMTLNSSAPLRVKDVEEALFQLQR